MSDEAVARIVAALERDGVSVTPRFLTTTLTRSLAAQARAAFEAGAFRAAGVGHAGARTVDPAIRGDQVLWLVEPRSRAQRAYLAQMETLRAAINARLYLGLLDFECHFARYPAGAYYRRHLDRFQQDARRTVSCVLYLNERWEAGWGGALRLYDGAHAEAACREVLPEGGTFVCFLSESVWHEVAPTQRERWSLTGWFRRRA